MLDLSQKASRSMESPGNGVKGIMHSTQTAVITIINILAGISILAVFSPLLVIILLGLSAIIYFILDYTKKQDKLYVWDFLSKIYRKEYYIRRIMMNFDSAKDIRLFSMSKWIISKFRKVQDIIMERMINCRGR